MAKIDDLQKKREERKAAVEAARAAQYEKDFEALDELEQVYGDDKVTELKLETFTPELPTIAVVKTPDASEYKRYRDMLFKAKGDTEKAAKAMELLADVCRVYPDDDSYAKQRAACPGIHDRVGVAAIKLADSKRDAEGKG